MKAAESLELMSTNPDDLTSEATIKNALQDYKTLDGMLSQAPALPLDPIKVAKFVVLLYSEDSILNTRPPKGFDERQYIAAKKAGFVVKDGEFPISVRLFLFNWDDKFLFEFMFEFLTKQKRFLWQDIITLETQMLENQRLRLRPVAEEKGKEDLTAFVSKDKMTKMFKEWRVLLVDYYDEFYGDNEQVRAIHKLNRENMATLENFAI